MHFYDGRGGRPYHAPHLAMRTIAWNCRSAGRALTVRALKELIRESNLDRVFLSETKIKSKRINKICDRLKFVDSWCVDANGLSGDLALFWRSGVDVEVVFSNKNMIVALVYSNPPEAPWLLFAIYGPNQRSKKEKFWEMLENMVSTFSGPWVVIRDLNCIKRAKKKRGGCAVTESSVSHLRDFMSNTGAINLGFTGPSFTWSNRREGLANIKERLDQGLCDQEWQSLFPKAGVKHLCNSNSDHNPIMLDTILELDVLSWPLRFEAMWTREKESRSIVENAWKIWVEGS